MSKSAQVEALVEKHYAEIYYYCLKKLNYDTADASDCTQEVFMILLKKQDTLDLNDHPRAWLYEVAGRLVKKYLRLKQSDADWTVCIDDVELQAEDHHNVYSMEILKNVLSEDEYSLIISYYEADFGTRQKVADQYGLSMSQLYKMVARIICKLRLTLEDGIE